MKKIIILILTFSSLQLMAQNKKAYAIFKSNGKKTTYKKMLKAAIKSDLIFFGEEHDNVVAHWLQLELSKDLLKKSKKNLILGAEMLEADNQEKVNDYLKGKIDYKTLKKETRLWTNFKTDYKPLLDFAKENNKPFIATNIPRRYAKIVFRGGFNALDTLPEKDKQWIAPLPIQYDENLSQYQKMLTMMDGHKGKNFPKAQAIKDATMAYNILKNRQSEYIFLHFNGSFHTNYHQGIVWYIRQKNPDLKILTIDVETQENLKKLDKKHRGKADFIIVTNKNIPRSY